MTEKKRGRIITGWRQVIPPKVRTGKPRPVPPPRGKAAPALPLVPGASPSEDEDEKDEEARNPEAA
jgi:hypothetical protein